MEREFEILVVEDDVELALNLKDILEEKGYPVAVAHNGQTALALFREKIFDLALIDIRLPDMSGEELIDQLTALSPRTEYIITTGYASLEGAAEAVRKKNIIAYEIKPIDIDRLVSFVDQVAQRRRAEEETRRHVAELQSHQRVITATLQTLDLDKRLSICLAETMQLVKAEMGAIYLVERDRLILRDSRGLPDDLLASVRDMPLAEMPWGSEITVRRERLSERGGQVDEYGKRAGVQSWATMPLKVEGHVIGTLMLASHRYQAFFADEVRALSTIAELVAVTIENARLYTETRQRLARLATLREIDRAIAADLSLEDVIKVVLKQVHPHIVGVDAVGFSLIDWEKKQTNLALLHLEGDVYIQGEAFVLSENLLKDLFVDHKQVIIYDLQADPRVQNHQNLIRKYRLKSYLGVPLIVKNQAIGVLHVLTIQPRHFREEEVDFFTTMGGQAAIAMRNAYLRQGILESEAKYRSLFENSKDGIYISSKDGFFIDINPVGVKLSGYTKEELLSMKIEALFVTPSERIEFMSEIEKQGFVKDYPTDIKRKDGTILNTSITAGARRDKDDRVIGYQGIIRDITERKRAEEERKRLLEEGQASYDELQRLSRRLVEAQEVERKDLARELHDRIGQNLTALSINLNLMRNQLSDPSGQQIVTRLDDSLKLLEEMTIRVRDLMGELHPPVLDDYGLFAALRWCGEQFSDRTGVTAVVRGKKLTPRLPLEVETGLFRITQEALNNVVKHAQAKRVTMTLESVAGRVRLTIADDGVGFDPKAKLQSKKQMNWGLITMRERAHAIGGDLRIETEPGKGTKVIVEYQLPRFRKDNKL
ncbi:GAF domain-containing protein [Patescibacteria group bacterium]|nr:GAF domain-containing protein [Patescibacteria group bacterium]